MQSIFVSILAIASVSAQCNSQPDIDNCVAQYRSAIDASCAMAVTRDACYCQSLPALAACYQFCPSVPANAQGMASAIQEISARCAAAATNASLNVTPIQQMPNATQSNSTMDSSMSPSLNSTASANQTTLVNNAMYASNGTASAAANSTASATSNSTDASASSSPVASASASKSASSSASSASSSASKSKSSNSTSDSSSPQSAHYSTLVFTGVTLTALSQFLL